jgi:inner membrane protein
MATILHDMAANNAWQRGMKGLSTGAKLVVVGLLALLMSLGAVFLDNLVDERTGRRAEAVKEISAHVGGAQTFLGPTLVVPYSTTVTPPPVVAADGKTVMPVQQMLSRGVYVVFPTTASATVTVKTEERRRAMFRVPVFQADEEMTADFDLAGVPNTLPSDAVMDWNNAEMVVGVSDARGALADAVMTTASGTDAMTPAATVPRLSYGPKDAPERLTYLGKNMRGVALPSAKFAVSVKLRFSGAQHIAMLPYGKSTRVEMRGDWANPSFNGGLLPASREVSKAGFHAVWTVPFIARGVAAQGDAEQISGLDTTTLGVSFAEVADPYQSMTRSVKYAPLFLGLVFLTYFLFEVTTGKRLHVAQYLLVGLAQLIFYLLLLSFAERAGFDAGFLIAGGASVALLATNVGWVFASKLQAMRAAGIFGALYSMIYMLLRLEDNAPMVGAIGSFAAVAAAMYFTRSTDWYGAGMQAAVAAGPRVDRVGEL